MTKITSLIKSVDQQKLSADQKKYFKFCRKKNYALGKIDVLTRNLEDFGQTAFRLQPAEISPALLDELGMFLIARSDNLPALIRDTPK